MNAGPLHQGDAGSRQGQVESPFSFVLRALLYRSLPLPEVVTQLGGEVKDSEPDRKSAWGPRYCSGTLYVGTSKFWGGLPLTLIPSNSLPPPLLPKETMRSNHLSGSFQFHPTCSLWVMSSNPNPAGTWKLLAPDLFGPHFLNRVLVSWGSAQSRAHCLF